MLASLSVLGILSGFVFAIVFAVLYLQGSVSLGLMIGLTVLFNFVMLFLSPIISDFMYKWIYRVKFYTLDELSDKSYIKKLKSICDKYKIKYPRIGIIDDLNPTAFTYGSTRNNARIVYTKGLTHFLSDDEVASVLAHEAGHVIHRDFIVMTIAATLLQVIYELYIFSRMSLRSKGGSSKDKTKGIWLIVAIVSYVFYVIGTYVVLFLSRLREYYADEFSAKEMGNSDLLSSALIKIAYGIVQVPDSEKTARLLNSTRSLGIFDVKSANDTGLTFLNTNKKKSLLEKALLFDIVNPWAGLLELKSTHPLIGKRIRRLSKVFKSSEFNFDKIIKETKVNFGKLWSNFFSDIFVAYLPRVVFIVGLGAIIFNRFVGFLPWMYFPLIVAGIYFLISLVKVNYMYPMKKFIGMNTLELMGDLYASPVRGKPVMLDGKVIGRGIPGLIVSEDMMYQDSTGIIYLNYESKIPFIGNLMFAFSKLEKLKGVESKVDGWFLRGATHHIELQQYKSSSSKFSGSVRFWSLVGVVFSSVLLAVIGFLI